MHAKRLTMALVLALMASGCSGDDASSFSEPYAEEAAVLAPTTTEAAVSTLPTATATPRPTPIPTPTPTPVPPWTTVTSPDWPQASLTEEFGGPMLIESMCVGLTLTGFDPDVDHLDDLIWTIEQLGIEVVDDGCDAAVDIEIVGSRTPDLYRDEDSGGTKRCWAGQFASGEVRIRLGDEAVGAGIVDSGDPPPESIRGCAGEDAPVRSEYWAGPVADVMLDALGSPRCAGLPGTAADPSGE